MYIVAFYKKGRVNEVCVGDTDHLFNLLSLLEKEKMPYKVATRTGSISEEFFGWGDHRYWRGADYVWEEN